MAEANEEYKKVYWPLALYFLAFLLFAAALCLFHPEDGRAAALLCFNFITIWITAISFHIDRTGRIYWYTGVTYEDAKKMDPAERKRQTQKAFRRFLFFAVAFLVYSLLSWFLHWSLMSDVSVFVIGLIAIAISIGISSFPG